jgi:ATP-dependent DNA ligase
VPSIVLNEHFEEDGAAVFRADCQLGCEGIVSKRLGSIYRKGRSPHWLRAKNPKAPALMQAEEDGGGDELQHCGVVSSLIPNSAESILFLASVMV